MAETSRTPPEEWRAVVGYEGIYEVSDRGRVRSARGIRRLEPHMRGYLAVQLNRNAVRERALVHRLVAAAFCERPAGADIVRHLDGSRTNNVPSNLAWGTLSENNLDSVRHGTHRNARKTQCKQGHPYDEGNTGYKQSRGGTIRYCRTCSRSSRLRQPLPSSSAA